MDTGWRNGSSRSLWSSKRSAKFCIWGRPILCRMMCWGSAGKQPGWKGTEGPDAQLAQHEPGSPCCQEGRWYPGLHETPGEGILSLCSALAGPHLGYCDQFWASLYKRHKGVQKRFQQRDARVVKGLGYHVWREGWESWDHCTYRRKGSGGISSIYVNTLKEGAMYVNIWREAFFNGFQWQEPEVQTETQDGLSEHRRHIFS